MGGEDAFLMAFETEEATVYQVLGSHRNEEEVREVVPSEYGGVMVTDRGRSYDAQALSGVKQQKCLAHVLRSISEVVHAYPYRLDELQDWPKIVQLPRKVVLPFETPRPATTVNSARKYSNGDILVIIKFSNSDPEDGIVARIDRDGRPMWVRDDYNHHWTVIFRGPGGEELALVPASTFGDHPVGSRLRGNTDIVDPRLDCWDGSINQVDHLRVLRGGGSVIQDFRIIDSIIDSPFASLLLQARHTTPVTYFT